MDLDLSDTPTNKDLEEINFDALLESLDEEQAKEVEKNYKIVRDKLPELSENQKIGAAIFFSIVGLDIYAHRTQMHESLLQDFYRTYLNFKYRSKDILKNLLKSYINIFEDDVLKEQLNKVVDGKPLDKII